MPSKACSTTIHTAIKRYNEAALQLPQPRAALDAKTVLDYVFLAQFDFIWDSQHHVSDKPWSRYPKRLAMNSWYKIQCSNEELDCVIKEV